MIIGNVFFNNVDAVMYYKPLDKKYYSIMVLVNQTWVTTNVRLKNKKEAELFIYKIYEGNK